MTNSELFLKDNVTPGAQIASGQTPAARDFALDRIRLLAASLVVLTHTSAQWLDRVCANSGAALLFTQLCSIVSFAGVSLFVMLSGALFLSPSHREKSCSVRRMCRRSLHFLLLYFLWKIFYLLEDGLLYPEILKSKGIKDGLILAFFRLPGKYHLWYLPMLCVLLLIVPLLYEGAQHRMACFLYLGLSFLCAVLLPTAFLFDFPFKYLLMDFRDLFDLNYFLGYLGYFLLGHVLYECCRSGASVPEQIRPIRAHSHTLHEQVQSSDSPSSVTVQAEGLVEKTEKGILPAALWGLALVTLLPSVCTASARSAGQTQADTSFASPFSLAVCLLSAAIFLTICRNRSAAGIHGWAGSSVISNKSSCPSAQAINSVDPKDSSLLQNSEKKGRQLLPAFSRASFGVYLLHPFALDLITKSGVLVQIPNPFVGIPILLAVLLILSFAASLLMNRISILRRLVS